MSQWMFSRSLIYLGASLEQNGLCSRTPTEGKSAHGLGSPVVEAIQHLVQAFMAQGVHERFTELQSAAEVFWGAGK
jgi:hypothetical protein